MQSDPIVAAIREMRERRAERFGYDIRAIAKDAQERDAVDYREVVSLPPRRLDGSVAAEIREARKEFAEGRCVPATPEESMREIVK